MLSLSEERIKALAPGITIKRFRQTFQNCLAEGDLPNGQAVFAKSYSTHTHYATEKLLLGALAKSKTGFRTPELLNSNDDQQLLVMSALAGKSLLDHDLDSLLLTAFALTLKSFHQSSLVLDLPPSNIERAVAMYADNIANAQHLGRSERRIARSIVSKLERSRTQVGIAIDQLVHQDMNNGNLLYDASQPLPFALLDFERTGRGDGYMDLAKFAWRVLNSDALAARELLAAYLQRKPTAREEEKLFWFMGLEYIGAISYFEYRGHAENYPFKDEAFKHLERWPLL